MRYQEMDINNSISFTSRNYEIRRADDIARRVVQNFPMLSSSKMSSLPNAEKFSEAMDRLDLRLSKSRMEAIKTLQPMGSKLSPKDRILGYLAIIKNNKLGNCPDTTKLAMIFSYLKGIKNTHVADIKNIAGEHLDHVALYVENGKKPYIIDPWLGFADYLPNAIQRYKSDFSYIFPFEKAKSQKFTFNKYPFKSDTKIALEDCNALDLREIRKACGS